MPRNWFDGNSSTKPPTSECTACQTTILERSDTKIHRELGCIICKQCYGNYALTLRETKNGEGFSLNKFGHQSRCRWCCNDKYLIACTTCRRAFCQGCVRRHDSEAEILNVYHLSPDERVGHTWACFLCDARKQVQYRQEAAKFKSDQEAYHEEHRDPNCPSPPQSDDELDGLDLESSSGTEIDEQDVFEQQDLDSTSSENRGRKNAETISGQDSSSPGKSIEIKDDENDDDDKDEKVESFLRARPSYRASNWSIVGHQIKDRELHFEVSWEGFMSEFDTREPVKHVMTNHQELRSYLKKVKEQDCFNFDALIKMAPELADVFRSTASDLTAYEFSRACAKTSKMRSIRVEEFIRAPIEPALASISQSKKRKSPPESHSPHSERQSPLKKKAIQTPVTSEMEARNKISGNNSVNVESHGNSKQSAEQRPVDRQAQSPAALKFEQMIAGPSNNSVTTPGNRKHLDKPRKNFGTEKSSAAHSINQPQPSTSQSPSKHKSPIKDKSQASVSSEILAETGATLANTPASPGKACEKNNNTRAPVISVSAEQSTSNASANIISVSRKGSTLARMLETPSKNPVSQAHIELSASIVSNPRAASELIEEPQQETQLMAKTEPLVGFPLQVSAGREIGNRLGDSIQGNQYNVSSRMLIIEAPANLLAKVDEPNSRISDNAPLRPPDPGTQIQRNTDLGQIAQSQLSSEMSSKRDNQGSTLTPTNKMPLDQHDHDYRIPKLKRHYQISASSQPSKDQLPQTREKTNNKSQEKTSLSREQSSAASKTEESNTSTKKTSNYPDNVKAAPKQQHQKPLKSFVASSNGSNRSKKHSASRSTDSKDRNARRKSTDRDASVGTDSSGHRRSSSHSTSRASSRDSCRSTIEDATLTENRIKTHSNSRSELTDRVKETPIIMRRHSRDEYEPHRDRKYDDKHHSWTPRTKWSNGNKTPDSNRREIFSRLDEPLDQTWRTGTLARNKNKKQKRPRVRRRRRKARARPEKDIWGQTNNTHI